MLAALAVFIGGPLQFSPTLRARRPALHRLIGRLYIGGATLAALTAVYLGATIEYEGSRLPIVLLGLLWLFFTLAAWRCALAGNFAAHRLFMIRSYGLGLVLVWLRLMSDLQAWLFFYVHDEAMRDATREWASWVVPLLVLELWSRGSQRFGFGLDWGRQTLSPGRRRLPARPDIKFEVR